MKHIVACIFVLVFLPAAVFCNEQVDLFVQRQIEKHHIPGVAVLVMQDGKIIKEKGYGLANIEHQVPVKPETVFQSGSIGKQFTATAVMILVEEGKVSLDDPIRKFMEKAPDSWKGITIRHLLTHTSGLDDYPEDFDFRRDFTEDEEFEVFTKTAPAFTPGEKWSYSNVGYATLGFMIHKVTGKFYGDFLRDRVFVPLGMTATRVISESDIVPNRAGGYLWTKGEFKNQEWVSPTVNTTADGSLYFTIQDLAKWDAALYSEKILKKSSLDLMWTPAKLTDGSTYPYGFGWGIDEVRGHRNIEHGGSWQGFNTHIARYVQDRLTVVVLMNRASANPDYVAHSVAGIYVPDLAPTKRAAVSLTEEKLKAYAGKYELGPGRTIQVSADSNKLTAIWGDDSFELLPESDTVFFQEDSELVVRFAKSDDGDITHMLLGEREIRRLKKIE